LTAGRVAGLVGSCLPHHSYYLLTRRKWPNYLCIAYAALVLGLPREPWPPRTIHLCVILSRYHDRIDVTATCSCW